MMWNKSDENGYPCLVTDHREKDFSFATMNMILAVGLLNMIFIMFRYILSISSLLTLLSLMDVEFWQMIFLHLLKL